MNPFAAIPTLHGDSIMELYYRNTNSDNGARNSNDRRVNECANSNCDDFKMECNVIFKYNMNNSTRTPPPHINAVAQNAYSYSLRQNNNININQPQAIIEYRTINAYWYREKVFPKKTKNDDDRYNKNSTFQ